MGVTVHLQGRKRSQNQQWKKKREMAYSLSSDAQETVPHNQPSFVAILDPGVDHDIEYSTKKVSCS